ncbi:MAG: hypothetical protein ABI471_05195 [Sphingomonas bacterium]
MSDTVWISRATGDESNLRPLKHSFSNDDQRKIALEWSRANLDGYPLGSDFFPHEIWGISSAKEKDYKLPNFFLAGSFCVVSAAAATVLQQFDLGEGGLYPVKVLKNDHETPVGGEWFCINFGNRKSAFLPQSSQNIYDDYIRNGEKGWFLKEKAQDNDVAVSPLALTGPDIWVDPDVGYAFFVSDSLANALRKAEVDKGFFLTKCRVI